MLVDRAVIFVRSGKGGDGRVSFRRLKYVPKGGPDGGDGGDGGDVSLVATAGVDTLLDLSSKHHWYAGDGQPGGSKQCYGKDGADLEVAVPPGTLVYDDETGELVADLDEVGRQLPIVKGGRGGFGNEHFKSPTNQAPQEATPGEPGQERTLRLELKLVADVGLIGVPNAGKSTLLSRVSRARPKIGAYPFTTIEPNLGIAPLSGYRRVVVADIPGLLEGAHRGHGLGTQFLRHIERTRVLVHVLALDVADGDGDDDDGVAGAVTRYQIVRDELASYSEALANKREIVVLNKTDLFGSDAQREDAAVAVERAIGKKVIAISGVTGDGVVRLMNTCWDAVDQAKVVGAIG